MKFTIHRTAEQTLSQEDQAAKEAAMKQRASAAQIAQSGLDTRIKGHVVTLQTARHQRKRDAKQED